MMKKDLCGFYAYPKSLKKGLLFENIIIILVLLISVSISPFFKANISKRYDGISDNIVYCKNLTWQKENSFDNIENYTQYCEYIDKVEDADLVKQALREQIEEILDSVDSDLKLETKPSVILFVGVNGVGKTTSIGKIANNLRKEGKKVIVAAADTFRAAAVEQLEVWANRAQVQLVKRPEGTDPASVVFDAIKTTKQENADVLIIDTAGRLHNKKYLMDELIKINKVIDKELPDVSKEVLMVLDATTGQNAIMQVKAFKEAVNINGLVLTKLDGTSKGGAVIGIVSENNLSIKFIERLFVN